MAPPKKINGYVKLQIEAGKATPAPPDDCDLRTMVFLFQHVSKDPPSKDRSSSPFSCSDRRYPGDGEHP